MILKNYDESIVSTQTLINTLTKTFNSFILNDMVDKHPAVFIKGSPSVGKSISAQIPWISISRYGNYREDGPIFLYFKSKRKLILSFGVKDGKSNDSKYNFKWSEQILNNYQNIKDFFGEDVLKHNDSYVFKSYDISEDNTLINGDDLDKDVKEILNIYNYEISNVDLISFINNHYNEYEKELTNLIQKERERFINKFPLESIKDLTLEEYNKLGDIESFSNYIENKTNEICSGFLGTNRNRLFFEKEGKFDTIDAYKNRHHDKSVNEIFEIFKNDLYNYIRQFNIEDYNPDILRGRINVIKFKTIRLYRPDIKLYGLPSLNSMKLIIEHLNLEDPRKEEVMYYNIVLTEYLNVNDSNISSKRTDLVNVLIWEYFNKYIKENEFSDENIEIDIKKTKGNDNMLNKNIILYGPPGTGKTYNTKYYAVAICESKDLEEVLKEDYEDIQRRYDDYVSSNQIAFTTFHQSYGYEEFIEGLFPEIEQDTNQIVYKIKDGVFKEFCSEKNSKIDFETAWDNLIKDIEEQKIKWGDVIDTAEDQTKDRLLYLNYNGNIIIPYGNGIVFTKESAFKYYNGENVENTSRQGIRYIYEYFVKNYYSNHTGPKVFIIDEINRGNISKIFGELITLIEESKRAGEKEDINATLPYSKESFSVPNNVYLLGTMNTADRSIALMDTALRRRFSFVEMMPDVSKLEDVEIEGLNIGLMLKAINDRINVLYDREHTIGHAYFMNSELNLNNLENIFRNKIIPLLQEYFYEDYEKIRWVLGDNFKEDEDTQFILERRNNISSLFKGNVDADLIPEYSYEINEKAFKNIESYKGII